MTIMTAFFYLFGKERQTKTRKFVKWEKLLLGQANRTHCVIAAWLSLLNAGIFFFRFLFHSSSPGDYALLLLYPSLIYIFLILKYFLNNWSFFKADKYILTAVIFYAVYFLFLAIGRILFHVDLHYGVLDKYLGYFILFVIYSRPVVGLVYLFFGIMLLQFKPPVESISASFKLIAVLSIAMGLFDLLFFVLVHILNSLGLSHQLLPDLFRLLDDLVNTVYCAFFAVMFFKTAETLSPNPS